MADPGVQLQRVLLVRSAEERHAGCFTQEDLSRAALAALNARDDRDLLVRRAEFLAGRLPPALQGCAELVPLDRAWRYAAFGGMTLLGVLSNFLGPPGVVLLLYNPLTALLAWNLLVYVLMALAWLRWRRSNPIFATGAWRGAKDRAAVVSQLRSAGPGSSRWLFRPIYSQLLRLRAQVDERSSDDVEIARRYAQACWDSSGPIFSARLASLLHHGALGIVLGALLGTYVRGLFLQYEAAWHSTFITDPGTVAAVLNVVLGPASLLLDGQWLDAPAVTPLLTPGGTPAAPWIHKLALTVIAIVVVPRLLLARRAARRLRIVGDTPQLDLSEPYYVQTIAAVREGQIKRIREGVHLAVRRRTAQLADSIAQFVCSEFFDSRVRPALTAFREKGGRINELEQTLAAAAEELGPLLAAQLAAEQASLQQQLSQDIGALIGKASGRPRIDASGQAEPALLTGVALPRNVATGIADLVGTTVTGAVTALAAAVSGGAGKSVGIAVISHLLAISGPIGLLLGAIGGLVVAGGAYVVGRERVAASVKGWKLPALALAIPLRDARIAEARQQTYEHVKRQLEGDLNARSISIAEQILQQLS